MTISGDDISDLGPLSGLVSIGSYLSLTDAEADQLIAEADAIIISLFMA